MKTASIDPWASCLTLINVYEVEPHRQAELAGLLLELTEASIRHQPGFLSVSIHASLDGGKIVNYAQWASPEHFQRFLDLPDTKAQLQRFAALALSVSPGLYKVSSVLAE